jgi:hypothetical protein
MKKVFTLLTIVALGMCMIGCGDEKKKDDKKKDDKAATTAPAGGGTEKPKT